MESCILYLNNFLQSNFIPLSIIFEFLQATVGKSASFVILCNKLLIAYASITILSDRSSLPPEVSLSETVSSHKVPAPICSRIFLARTFTSIPKIAFHRLQCLDTLRHDVAKFQTQVVMTYPLHGSTVSKTCRK